jgi:hypothetical protein
MATIPDSDAESAVAEIEKILADTRLGSTQEERLKSIGRSRKAARFINVAALIIILWAFAAPRPYLLVLALLALLPWIAIAAIAGLPGRYRANEGNRFYPDLTFALIGPGMMLAVRAVLDTQILGEMQPVLPGVLIGVLLALVTWAAFREGRERIWIALIFVPFMSAYGYGGIILANKLLDGSRPEIYRAQVLDKSVSAANKHGICAWGRGARA